jgi:hypothetical protein
VTTNNWPSEIESINKNIAEGRELLRRAMVRLDKLKKPADTDKKPTK